MSQVKNEDAGRRRGVCSQILSPIRQRSTVQLSSCQRVPLEPLALGFLQGSATVTYGTLLLFIRCFMAVHVAQHKLDPALLGTM